MRYRSSRKPPGSDISWIFSNPLLAFHQKVPGHAVKGRVCLRHHGVESPVLASWWITCDPFSMTYAVKKFGARQREHAIRKPSLSTRSTHQQRGVDSRCEPADRCLAPRGDRSGNWHRGMGAGRAAAPARSRSISGVRVSVSRSLIRLRGTRWRGRLHTTGRLVRSRDERHDRCGRDRDSVERTESSNGLIGR
jgi:hypothetical protein